MAIVSLFILLTESHNLSSVQMNSNRLKVIKDDAHTHTQIWKRKWIAYNKRCYTLVDYLFFSSSCQNSMFYCRWSLTITQVNPFIHIYFLWKFESRSFFAFDSFLCFFFLYGLYTSNRISIILNKFIRNTIKFTFENFEFKFICENPNAMQNFKKNDTFNCIYIMVE